MPSIKDIWFYANNVIKIARQMINEELDPLNLSSAEGNILLHLLTTGEVYRQDDLVEQLEISKPAVSRALYSLQEKGFITRERDETDKRISRVRLTQKALEVGPQVEKVYENIFALAARGISEAEIEGFIALFGRISESFTTAREKERQRRASNDS